MENTEVLIEKAIAEYQQTDASISELSQKYMSLVITGVDDKEGYKLVHEARMDMKSRRIDVEKTRKGLKEEALKYGKAVDTEAKRIMALISPIEDHLLLVEKAVDNEKERIKNEAGEAEKKRVQDRVNKLYAIGMTFDGTSCVYLDKSISPGAVSIISDGDFDMFISSVEAAVKTETQRLADIQAEADRQEVVHKEQEAKAVKLKAESDRIEAEKQRLAKEEQDRIDEVDRKAHEEQIRKETEAKVLREAEEAKELDAAFTAEAERVAKLEAELAEKLKPDNEKLLALADEIESFMGFTFPSLTNDLSCKLLNEVDTILQSAVQKIRGSINGFQW